MERRLSRYSRRNASARAWALRPNRTCLVWYSIFTLEPQNEARLSTTSSRKQVIYATCGLLSLVPILTPPVPPPLWYNLGALG